MTTNDVRRIELINKRWSVGLSTEELKEYDTLQTALNHKTNKLKKMPNAISE